MKKFNDEHQRILNKNRSYYEGLISNGTLTKMSSVIVDEFKLIYREVINPKGFNTWCSACVAEAIEIIYLNYDQFLKENERTNKTEPNTRQAGKQPGLPASKSKGKGIRNRGRSVL